MLFQNYNKTKDLLFFVINKQKKAKNYNHLKTNNLQKTKRFAMLFYFMIKMLIMLNIFNILYIENQMVNNKAITKLFQNYRFDITINKIFIGNALR